MMNWDWKQWAVAALIRAIRTFAQTFVSMIAVAAAFSEIDWIYCLNRASRETPHRFYECKEALRDSNQSVKLNPYYARGYVKRGNVYMELKMYLYRLSN